MKTTSMSPFKISQWYSKNVQLELSFPKKQKQIFWLNIKDVYILSNQRHGCKIPFQNWNENPHMGTFLKPTTKRHVVIFFWKTGTRRNFLSSGILHADQRKSRCSFFFLWHVSLPQAQHVTFISSNLSQKVKTLTEPPIYIVHCFFPSN